MIISGVDLTDQTVNLSEDTVFERCRLDRANIVPNGYQFDLCNCQHNGVTVNGKYIYGPYVEPEAVV